jgi:phosphoribosyl 1,2-cyclic phosphodiesterase
LYGPRCRVTIYGGEADGALESHLQGQMRAPYFPVAWDTVPAEVTLRALRPGEQVQLGALTVDPFELRHTQPTLGFRLTAHGATAVFATDHEHGVERYGDCLRESAAGAGVLICDAQYTPEEYEARRGWGHTTWREAVGFAEDAGAARVALFHHDPTHDDAALAQVLEDATAASPRVFLASEGQEVRL